MVEKGVDLTYKRIYAPLRDKTFHSLAEINAAFRDQLDLFNARAFKNKTGSRIEWFEADENPLLKSLPSTRYEIKHVTQSKVPVIITLSWGKTGIITAYRLH